MVKLKGHWVDQEYLCMRLLRVAQELKSFPLRINSFGNHSRRVFRFFSTILAVITTVTVSSEIVALKNIDQASLSVFQQYYTQYIL